MNEYRVKVTIKNNLLLSAIENAGYASQAEFARACNLTPTAISDLVNMRVLPITRDGEFIVNAKVIMEVLGAAPSDLWTDMQLTMRLKANTREKVVSEQYINEILENHIENMTLESPEEQYLKAERKNLVDVALLSLTPKEAKIITQRFYEEKSLDEVGNHYGITRERVRQIEQKALRKLRHPTRSDALLIYTSKQEQYAETQTV